MPPASHLLDLACTRCATAHDADVLQRHCACGGPLYARYDLDAAAAAWHGPHGLGSREPGLWRYAELLPVREPSRRLRLGEGGTPLLEASRLAARLGVERLLLKDEGLNPTGSFKARGLCLAVSRAVELGARALAIPTAGNAGGALAAYAARAGVAAHVYMPSDTPAAFVDECRSLGADVVHVDGTIADAGAALARDLERHDDWFPVSTLKEPYRIEGKKTMGLELAEALGWQLPDVVVYPTGGGTGLLGIWKAFDELERMGLVGPARPRMVAVQSEGCAPIVEAFHGGATEPVHWEDAATLATGLRVPAAFAGREILQVLRESDGDAVAVSDDDIVGAVRRLGAVEGIWTAPEAAATLAGLELLLEQGRVDAAATTVLLLTANAHKYREVVPT